VRVPEARSLVLSTFRATASVLLTTGEKSPVEKRTGKDGKKRRPVVLEIVLGKVFGKLTVESFNGWYCWPGKPNQRQAKYNCRCVCGSIICGPAIPDLANVCVPSLTDCELRKRPHDRQLFPATPGGR
jgi:hypothetical protein